jgi:RNA polymerase sigma factor (sigma-70 family)
VDAALEREGEALEREAAVLERSVPNGNGHVEQRADLIAALSALSPRARAVIVLRYYGDLSEAQVADTLGCSLGTVKSTTSRALATLRKQGADTYAAR